MHSGAEGCAGVDVEHHFLPIIRLYILPGRNHENIIDIELMKILLPVVDPVNVLCLIHGYGTLPDLAEESQLLELTLYIGKNLLHSGGFILQLKRAVLLFFHEEAQISDTVVLGTLRQNVDKHLLLLPCGEGDLVLDLRTLQTNIIKSADDNVLSLRHCLNSKLHPFHRFHRSFIHSIAGDMPPATCTHCFARILTRQTGSVKTAGEKSQ